MISPMAMHLTYSHSFPSYKLFFVAAVAPEPRLCQFRVLHGRRLLAAVCASSLDETSVRVASRKQVRTNADLCNDLREFMSEAGLPDGHVPSLKELLQHGRQDLANVVRRRGYKLIRELLAASREINVADSNVEGSLTDKQDKSSIKEDELTGLDENGKELAEDVFLSSEDTIIEETSNSKSFDDDLEPDVESCFLVDGSTKSSLQEKVVKFIQNGELEIIEDYDLDVVNAMENSGSQQSTEPELSSASEGQVLCVSDSPSLANGSILSSELVLSTSQLRNISSNDQLASAESANTDKDVDAEIRTKEDKTEINRIKVMLHHKESELSQLKEQIEKNKQALLELQAKAETEISKAQKLLLDKDAELHAAEESLSGLKQVQVEYWGDGETVEVAGSFNGWHHGVKLDLQPSSNITDPVELRTSRLWRSMLWLYPGIYEIKFIVDGKWMIDPMKETVTRGTIHNNVLRVDR
ncbi:protein PTST homolog 3, chloroplastic [Cynara cardunculus var. scolymus]|uniref:protein PTST homolog 3, chloroplastic n=1 Tax=Cynara cardunculus var. scolymus TaxID=59895 RepID=UPI000D628E24|nr:protein PTST homolog 3, chloroplastic [Cynara cardunculus var. scolymus]